MENNGRYSHLLPSPLPFLGKEELAGSGRDVSAACWLPGPPPASPCSAPAIETLSRIAGSTSGSDLPYMR